MKTYSFNDLWTSRDLYTPGTCECLLFWGWNTPTEGLFSIKIRVIKGFQAYIYIYNANPIPSMYDIYIYIYLHLVDFKRPRKIRTRKKTALKSPNLSLPWVSPSDSWMTGVNDLTIHRAIGALFDLVKSCPLDVVRWVW